jgi:hypothetical protein
MLPVAHTTSRQASLFGHSTEELAALLRADYRRLEPYRQLLASVALRCGERLMAEHGIRVNPNDALASAEDFMLAMLNESALPLPDAMLSLAMQAHVNARCLEFEARRMLREPKMATGTCW